ncbi:MAG: 4-hydroxy-3-methylbut-2-enyl diphosphate reductase [Coriobacteriia bacterium]|nr:4-hydroxy-3-methylbut-2-enyl diphosphate reductase [Coriobacteriia bacterium]
MIPQIRIARDAGVCYGVERALKLAHEAAGRPGQTGHAYTLGPLIHNPRVVAELAGEGVAVTGAVDSLSAEDTLIIRTHGVEAARITEAQERGITVIDATCPYVRKVQQAVRTLSAEGYQVIIIGEPDHPEVIAVRSHADASALVVSSFDDIPADFSAHKAGVVVQTTQTLDVLQAVTAALMGRCQELRIYNTICDATSKRQEATRELALDSEVMVVVGGQNSGNTTRLAAISRDGGARTYHIERPEELEQAWFSGVQRIGVTAGASTPAEHLAAVVARIEELVA